METFGSMEKEEKVRFILEQMRLGLARKDYIRTQIISKKISIKFFASDTDVVQVKYRILVQVLKVNVQRLHASGFSPSLTLEHTFLLHIIHVQYVVLPFPIFHFSFFPFSFSPILVSYKHELSCTYIYFHIYPCPYISQLHVHSPACIVCYFLEIYLGGPLESHLVPLY